MSAPTIIYTKTDEAPALASKQLFAPNEAPVAIALPGFRVESVDGKWMMSPGRGES